MRIMVRTEKKEDHRRVEEITRLAFSYPGRIERGKIGCPYEHWMVNELRKRDGILPLSLVAVVEDEIVGHIICSNGIVKSEKGTLPVLNLGPISVLPEFQRKGVGKALITHMIDKAKELGYGAILFFGRPEYYPQFGFVEAGTFGITDCEGYNYPAFMGMELVKGYLSESRGGKYIESDIYNDELNRMKVKAFDDEFMGNQSNLMFQTERLHIIKADKKYLQDYYTEFTEKICEFQYPDTFTSLQDAQELPGYFLNEMNQGNMLELMILDQDENFLGSMEVFGLKEETMKVGLWLKESCQGQGYGYEALRGLIDYLNVFCPRESYIYEVDERNLASIALVKKFKHVVGNTNEVVTESGKRLNLTCYQILK